MPATNVLANVYQLYMVEYQCASMLINHNQGTVDITVKANHTMNNAAHTVVLKIYRRPASTLGSGLLSISLDTLRIFHPSTVHPTMVSTVHITKKVVFKNGVFPFKIASCCTASLSTQW